MNIKKTINDLHKKNTNYSHPEQAIDLAEALKSLSSDLYTDSKRFIYELLQNADDSSIENQNVDVSIQLFGNVLVLAHTGKAFTPEDIQGVCSVNNGTKKSDASKTGYKGIGFKSVFGQSEDVTIFSNQEYFKFDANYNFGWKKESQEWGESQEKWEQKNNKRKFSYPWQIIPIYLDETNNHLNLEIQNFLTQENWNVATIVKVSNLNEIKKSIEELSNNINMFLFLKKITSITFKIETVININIERNQNELVLKKDTKIVNQWITNTTSLVVPLYLKELLKADANIPKKLKETDKIELTLGIKKTDKGLERLSDNESLLYAYLPTDEKKYSLPVLVNSTFLTSANREHLHTNSKWNEWLFESISLELFKLIAQLVQGEYSYQVYNLIPNKLEISDDLSIAYNRGIDKAIDTIPFILSKEDELLKVNQAIIDETSLSMKDFIDSNTIVKFIKHQIGDKNKIVDKPFINYFNNKLIQIGVKSFSWTDIMAFFAFDRFKTEHTTEKNIQLIKYFKNETEIPDSSFPKDKLKSWTFILDHKGKLNYPNKICFPKIDDTNWNNSNSDLDYANETLYDLAASNPKMKGWLEKLGVQEKTDISYLDTVIIPDAGTYCTLENHDITIKYLYSLYSNEDIKNDKLEQLSKLKLLTQKGDLISASQCYFSDNFQPRLEIEKVLTDNIFLSDDYLVLDKDKGEVKRFFNFMGVQEGIKFIKFKGAVSKSLLIDKGFSSSYFTHYSDNTYNMQMHTYLDITTFSFLEQTNHDFLKLFWNDVIQNIECNEVSSSINARWGHYGSSEYVESYIKWYIKNNKCLPIVNGSCEIATNIFLNSERIKEIAGKYLSVFDGVEPNSDWKSFFQFKTQLELNDYLELLVNIMNDKTAENKITIENKKRIQLIFKALLEQSANWSQEEIEKVKVWSETAYLADEDNNIVLCSELKFYADGDNSIFQKIYQFLFLNEENKAHSNMENLLGYFGIDILNKSIFNISCEGEKVESDLKDKLENIFPYLKSWIQKLDSTFKIESLTEKLDLLQINEAFKLLLSYDEIILKSVQVHLEKDELIVTTPWTSNKVMLDLPRMLCSYFEIKGYEDKLIFLLRSDDEFEIKEHFTNEEIDLPIINVPVKDEKVLSKEEAISFLNITEKEFDEIKKFSDDYHHTSNSSIDKLQYIHKLLKRSRKRVIEHLGALDEYNCDNIDNNALTVLSGVLKYNEDIYIIPRPSDGGKVILYHPSEFDTLEYADSELWYEDGSSVPKKLTLGKILKDAKINRIPV
jgi:hypothetical protein